MTELDFNQQIDRLKDAWPSSFASQKIKLIWNAVGELPIKWFEKLVTDILSNNRQAPLPVEFITATSIKRKADYGGIPGISEIHPSENSIFSKKDIAEIFSMMKKRLNGEISYKELDQYSKMFNHTGLRPVEKEL